MEFFAEYTISQIKLENKEELIRCFNFQESVIDDINSNIENALDVAYFESLIDVELSNKFIELLPSKLKKKYRDYEVWYKNLLNQ